MSPCNVAQKQRLNAEGGGCPLFIIEKNATRKCDVETIKLYKKRLSRDIAIKTNSGIRYSSDSAVRYPKKSCLKFNLNSTCMCLKNGCEDRIKGKSLHCEMKTGGLVFCLTEFWPKYNCNCSLLSKIKRIMHTGNREWNYKKENDYFRCFLERVGIHLQHR